MGLRIALPKGRLADEVLRLMEEAGIAVPNLKHTRKLAVSDSTGQNTFFLVKPSDVPAYVEGGAADIGVAGYDTICEESRVLASLLDLDIGKCAMAIAGDERGKELLAQNTHIRVATKYPRIAEKHLFATGRLSADVIKLNGSVELAAAVGLADIIVDIVQTGDTLRQNGLCVIEEVFPVSARLIANTAALALYNDDIANITKKLRMIICSSTY